MQNRYFSLSRLLQRSVPDTCNSHKWSELISGKKISFIFYFTDYFQIVEHIKGELFSVSQKIKMLHGRKHLIRSFRSDDNLDYSMGVLLVYPSGQIPRSEHLWDADFAYWMFIIKKMELVISSSSQVLKGCNQKESEEKRREVLSWYPSTLWSYGPMIQTHLKAVGFIINTYFDLYSVGIFSNNMCSCYPS